MLGQTNKSILTQALQRRLRRNLTDAERRLWQLLRAREMRGFKFRRQHPFGDFILDFVCLERRLVIEVDGGQHSEQAASDMARTRTLEQAGFRVLRFWNDDILKKPEGVGEKIWAVLDEPHPQDPIPTLRPPFGNEDPIPTQPPLEGEAPFSKFGEGTTDHPHIRSYVLRQGRMSVAQKRAYDQLLSRYAIPYSPAPLDLSAAFGRVAPTILEIGFGMGETTTAIALAHPENNYLGVEVHSPGVGSLLKQIDVAGLSNLRLIQHDAADVVRDMIPLGSLDGVHVFFPDPWPKNRHHKRRLIQLPFVALIASRLRPGGYFHLATDWQEYAQQMLDVLSSEPVLANIVDGFAPRPAYRPQTKFEQRGLRLGHGVWDVIFQRRPMATVPGE